MDPIKIEKLFEKVSSELKLAGSERTQLFLIYEFLSSLNGKYRAYDSYIIQLFDAFPTLNQPLLFTGIKPEEFARVINDCEKVISAIPELKEKELMRKIDFLKSGLYQIHDWLGLKNEAELRRELLPAQMATGQKRGKEKSASEVLVPVVETSGNFRSKGRLRRLKVEVVGAATSEKAELRPVFGVIGANAGSLGEQAAEAAVKLLKESTGKRSFWKGTASFELSHAWHAGDSANLALSGLFYCEMLRAENRREYFRLNPGIAITGNIDEQGNVLPVDAGTIQYKIEAAFYSWVQVLVVPLEQVEEATNYLGELESEYPSRNLVLKGVGHVRELFYDRRLTMHKQRSVIKHTSMQIWRHRYNWAFLLVVLVLLGVIGRLIYGPVDRNPASILFDGNVMKVMNESGKELIEIEMGDYTVYFEHYLPSDRKNLVSLIDANNDGQNEILWTSFHGPGYGRQELVLGNVDGDTLWTFEYQETFDYEFHPYANSGQQYIELIKSEDVDGDGLEEAIITTRHGDYFPSFLLILDANTAAIKKKYLHAGTIKEVLVTNIDVDDEKELIIGGLNNSLKKAFLGILDYEYIFGQGAAIDRYKTSGYKDAAEMFYVVFPKTLPIETSGGRRGFDTALYNISELADNGLKAIIAETHHLNDKRIENNAQIFYSFTDSLRVKSIGSSDIYDEYAWEIYESGQTDILADGKYLETFKDSLLYWNGESFQHEPTMNKEYLRAVGELTGGK